jgi:hypothetical protein
MAEGRPSLSTGSSLTRAPLNQLQAQLRAVAGRQRLESQPWLPLFILQASARGEGGESSYSDHSGWSGVTRNLGKEGRKSV